ncbi:MAG: hypothetical protein IPG07_03360 [Crocinitomicaceae bacterium]|nr:hypothetical protein [Crocinitomicaceae bacterium]
MVYLYRTYVLLNCSIHRQKFEPINPFAAAFFGLSITLEVLDFPSDPWNYRFFPSQLMFFILGSGGYLIYKRMQNKQVQVSQTLKYGLFIVVLLITLLYSFLEEVIDPFSLSVLTVAIYAVSIPVIF